MELSNSDIQYLKAYMPNHSIWKYMFDDSQFTRFEIKKRLTDKGFVVKHLLYVAKKSLHKDEMFYYE